MKEKTKKHSKNNNELYAVFKLLTVVEVLDMNGKKQHVKINGAEGYIPVFNNREDAEKNACDGKYPIFVVSTPL